MRPRGSLLPGSHRSRREHALLAATLAIASLAATLMLLPPAAFASLYGKLLYPSLSALFTQLTSWTVLPLGITIVPLCTGILLWRSLAPGRRLPLRRRLLGPLLLVVLLLSLYLVGWGANYRRPPLLELLNVQAREVTQEEIDAFAGELLSWVRSAAVELDSAGIASTVARGNQVDASEALASLSGELERLSLELGWPASLPARVKTLPAGTLLSSGYAGMLFPFTIEPQVDAGLSAVSRVAVGAHELAHAAGFASEEDADLAALMAGLRSPHPFARYATALSLLGRSLGSLSREQREFVMGNLPARAQEDLAEARSRTALYLRASLAARVDAVYDRLLRGQGVEAGVAAYGGAPRLAALLAREGILPAPPDDDANENGRPVSYRQLAAGTRCLDCA